jgi:hypothetical protein
LKASLSLLVMIGVRMSSFIHSPIFVRSGLYLCALLCFLPFMINSPSYIEDTPLRKALDSNESLYRDSCVAQLALLLPIVSDIIIDIFPVESNKASLTMTTRRTGIFTAISSRINVILGTILMSIPAFVPKSMPNLAILYLCCRRSSQTLLYWEYVWSLVMVDPENWPFNTFLFFASILCVGEILSVFSVNSMAMNDGKVTPLFVISRLLLYIPVAAAYLNCIRTLLRKSSVSNDKDDGDHNDSYRQEYMFIQRAFVATILFVSTIYIIITAVYWRVYTIDDMAMFVYNLMCIVYELAVIIFATQNLKFEVYVNMVSLRGTNVSAISHGILIHLPRFLLLCYYFSTNCSTPRSPTSGTSPTRCAHP